MNTENQIKLKCIEQLELLIQNIKNDKTSDNYSYNEEVLEFYSHPEGYTRYVSYGIRRTEYIENEKS